jgi:glutathione peroxidase
MERPMATAKTPAVLKFTMNPLMSGKAIALSSYAGKVLLVVNVASECGFTGQYKDLEALHQKYQDQGLVVLGIPANDFGAQEPGSNAEIAQFCERNYGVTFQMLEKIETPIAKHPFYAALISASGETPQWNSNVAPLSATLTRAVDSALRH